MRKCTESARLKARAPPMSFLSLFVLSKSKWAASGLWENPATKWSWRWRWGSQQTETPSSGFRNVSKVAQKPGIVGWLTSGNKSRLYITAVYRQELNIWLPDGIYFLFPHKNIFLFKELNIYATTLKISRCCFSFGWLLIMTRGDSKWVRTRGHSYLAPPLGAFQVHCLLAAN